MIEHTPECFASHIGTWMAEPSWMSQALDAVKSGIIVPLKKVQAPRLSFAAADQTKIIETPSGGHYTLHSSGVAIFHIDGPTMKGFSKYGGTSTVALRTALRAARENNGVTAGLMVIDSPGGHTAGQQQLGDEIAAFSRVKPMAAHGEDLVASAGLWSATQAGVRFTVNRSAEVGSIGTFTVLYDTSEAAKMDGIKAIPVTTGAFKGAGIPGAPITDEQVAEVRKRVLAINELFLQAIADGRGMAIKDVRAIADGRVWPAAEAKELGLVDDIMSVDEALAMMVDEYGKGKKTGNNQGRHVRMMQAEISQALAE